MHKTDKKSVLITISSCYLGMVVQHCVRVSLGPHRILAQEQYCHKLMAQLNSTSLFTSVCAV